MPKLSFRVNADTSPIKKFRTEIEQVEKTMIRIKGENFSFDHWIREFERLKNELEKRKNQISEIKKEILSTNHYAKPNVVSSLEKEYAQAKKEQESLVNETMNLSNKFGKAYDDLVETLGRAQKVTDSVTAKLIEQKNVVANLQSEVRLLNAEYRNADKDKKVDLLAQKTSKQKELERERVTLNDLRATQERAKLSVKGLADETRNYEKVVGKVSGAQAEANLVFSRFEKSLLSIGGLATLKRFGSDVLRVRGEFQQLDVALTTLLQSKEKANALMGQMVETAAKTPFNLTELATGAKQLVAYGFASEGVNDALVRLGNIASGLGLPLERLTYLYGTTMTQGRLYARDLMQFTTSGIPMLQGLADMFGVSTDKVNEMVTAGKIGFPEVQKVIENMTNEGGKFYNLMEEQSKTITGRISNLGDAWDTMLNKIGESQEGVINDSIDGLKYLVGNYEEVGRILFGLVATYGAYKAATIAYFAITRTYGIYDIVTKELQFAATMKNIVATKALTAQQALLNKTMLANPYVLVSTLVVGAAAAIFILADRTTTAEKAQKRFNDALTAQKQQLDETKRSVDGLISTIKNETATYYDKAKAYLKLQNIMPEVFKNMDIEKLKLMDILSYNKLIAEEINRRERVGAKTSLVLKTNAYNEAKERYSKTSSRNSNVLVYYAQMKAAEEDMKLAQKHVNNIEKIQSEANKQKKKEDAKPIIQNKEYWENLKKETQSQLDALSDIEAAGKKGATLKQKIAGYDKKIGSFSTNTSKQDNQSDKLLQQQEKYNLLLDKQRLEQIRAEEDRWNQVWQAQIDAMKDGSIKALSQMELNHKKEMQQLDRQQEDLLRKKIEDARNVFDAKEAEKASKSSGYKRKTFDGSSVSLSQSEKDAFDNQRMYLGIEQNSEAQAYLNKERQAWNDYLAEYGTFKEKKEAITAQYNEKISNASTKGEKEAFKKEREDKLKETKFDELKSSINFADMFGDLDAQSTDAISLMRNKLKEIINASAKDLKPTDLKALQDALSDIDLKMAERNPFGELEQGIDKYKTSTRAVIKAQEDLNTVQQGGEVIVGTYIDATGKIISKLLTQEQAERNLGKAQSERQSSLETLNKSVNSIGSKGMEVVNAGNQVVDMLGNLGVAVPEAVGKTLDGIGQIMSGLESIDITKPFSIVTGSVGILTGIGNTIAGIFGFGNKDAKNEKRIGRLQDQIEVLEKSYDKLGDSIEKAYSKDASKLIEQNNQMLEQQKVLIQNQIREEQDKKKTDDGRIKEWQNQIEEINKLIEDNKEKAIDAIFGEDLKSSIDNFAQAYANAWTSGEDKAKSAKDTVRDMMRQMVTESIKAAIQSSGKMEEIRNKLKQFYADNVLSGWEQDYIYNMADNLQKELDNKFGWADDLMKEDESTYQDSTSKGFQAMSQDTGEELNGRFTSLQIAGESILTQNSEHTKSLKELSFKAGEILTINTEIRNIADDTRDIIANSYLELQEIRENTGAIVKPIIQMQKDMEEVKKNTSRL